METALNLTGGLATVDVIGGEEMQFSQNYACPEHGISVDELTSPYVQLQQPLRRLSHLYRPGHLYEGGSVNSSSPTKKLSIREGAIKASGWYYADGSVSSMYYEGLGKRTASPWTPPICEMSKEAVDAILYGTKGERIEMHRENEFGLRTVLQRF